MSYERVTVTHVFYEGPQLKSIGTLSRRLILEYFVESDVMRLSPAILVKGTHADVPRFLARLFSSHCRETPNITVGKCQLKRMASELLTHFV